MPGVTTRRSLRHQLAAHADDHYAECGQAQRHARGVPFFSHLVPADMFAVATALGRFLHALHSFPVPEALVRRQARAATS
jgi:hypothetical protein